METLTISRKQDLLERAARLHKTGVFLPPDARNYVQAFLHQPFGFKDYQSAKEPVVDPRELYDLGEVAWLTVNSYNALVLNTSNMLIADIDFGDERINRHAGARDCDDVLTNLDELETLDENWFGFPDSDDDDKHDFRFAFQTYRVYRTHSGCRVICTSVTMPWEDRGWLAERFMQFLRGDPDYIRLCRVQKCYRARLTPKPWRDKGEGAHVCRLENVHCLLGDETVHPNLKEQIRLHDELTLPENEWSQLA